MVALISFYILAEIVNIIFTAKFGFSHPMDQPLAYKQVRMVLRIIRYLLATFVFIGNLSSNLLLAIGFLLMPLLIDKIIFQFCKNREKKRLARLYMHKSESNPNPMSKKEAEETAQTMVDMYVKNKEFAF